MEMDTKMLSHFTTFSFTGAFWEMPRDERDQLLKEWFDKVTLSDDEGITWFYQVFPTRTEGDFLIWNTVEAESKEALFNFNQKFAHRFNKYRFYAEPVQTLWGVTNPSMYSKRKTVSDQAMNPFAEQRKTYLIVYPFTKTADWYLKGRETRQGMMNEHIKVGREWPEITQLLLYSFGLQDDEFTVVYETEKAGDFSDLVYDLRMTEARKYTANDVPIITATNQHRDDLRSVLIGAE